MGVLIFIISRSSKIIIVFHHFNGFNNIISFFIVKKKNIIVICFFSLKDFDILIHSSPRTICVRTQELLSYYKFRKLKVKNGKSIFLNDYSVLKILPLGTIQIVKGNGFFELK